jgi:hypothetical protein
VTSRPLAAAVLAGVGIEAAALLAAAAWMIGQIVSGGSQALGTAIALVVFTVGLAAVLVAVALRLARAGSGPARATVVTWQLVQAGSAGMIIGASEASTLALGGAWFAAGLAVVVVALVVLDSWRAHRDDGGVAGERQAARRG